jgi:2-polyprenyl-3-methyl-5-hydroxy-6-metoxy-1,4-benzoquinol methylase
MLRSLIFSQELAELETYFHSFERLGLHVTQREETSFKVNQKCKEGTVLAYLQLAIEKSKKTYKDKPSVLELFCADGYYASFAKHMGAGRVTGIDWDEKGIRQANAVYSLLFGESDQFQLSDVYNFNPIESYDVVLCCGGLYHVSDPKRVLEDCFSKFSKRFLVVQSVISLENEDDNYFVTPAPGWSHGSRFSAGFLRKIILEVGWKIIDSHFNELEGNDRLCDRGSIYFFCQQ